MISAHRTKAISIALIAVLVTSAAYWMYSAYKKRELHQAVVALVTDTSAQLRDALGLEAGPPREDTADTLGRLDGHAAAVDRHLSMLRGLDTTSVAMLAAAADDYLLTAREILRREAASHRYHLQLSESARTLQNHMRNADRHSESWIPEAIRAKTRLEKDYRDYSLAADAYDQLLASFPAARAKMAEQVDAALLTDADLAATARKRAGETARRAADEIAKARQLDAYR